MNSAENLIRNLKDLTQCLKPCYKCSMTVRVLISVEKECEGIAEIANEIINECHDDDISVVFRVGGVDQTVKGKGKCQQNQDIDDYLF